MLNRRQLLSRLAGVVTATSCAGVVLPGLLSQRAIAADHQESQLIYLSPIKSNGALSSCQAEVWYVQHNSAMYVVTAADAWRTRAIAMGLTKTRIWVGDVGMWQSSEGRYKALPSLTASASNVTGSDEQTRLLTLFGNKYASEWSRWGPRFRNGLADGSRVLLRYQPS